MECVWGRGGSHTKPPTTDPPRSAPPRAGDLYGGAGTAADDPFSLSAPLLSSAAPPAPPTGSSITTVVSIIIAVYVSSRVVYGLRATLTRLFGSPNASTESLIVVSPPSWRSGE